MFKLTQESQFTARVRAQVPVDGGHREEPFKVRYRVIDTERMDDFDLSTTEGTDGFLRACIVELMEIADENGQPLPYNDDVRDEVIRIPYARIALVRGYFDNISKGRRGN